MNDKKGKRPERRLKGVRWVAANEVTSFRCVLLQHFPGPRQRRVLRRNRRKTAEDPLKTQAAGKLYGQSGKGASTKHALRQPRSVRQKPGQEASAGDLAAPANRCRGRSLGLKARFAREPPKAENCGDRGPPDHIRVIKHHTPPPVKWFCFPGLAHRTRAISSGLTAPHSCGLKKYNPKGTRLPSLFRKNF